MRVVDRAILARLESVPGLNVFDGLVPVEQVQTVGGREVAIVSVPLPYVVYYSSIGDDHEPRLSGRETRRSVFFTLRYMGGSAEQAKWAGERARAALIDSRLDVDGHRSWLPRVQESQRIWRDDEVAFTGGLPIFYGVDEFAVSITRTPATHGGLL